MSSSVVLGLDFGGTKIAAAVCDADGALLGTTIISADAARGAAANLSSAVDTGRELLTRVAGGRPLAAVGVSTFGIPGADGIALAPAIDGWADLAIARELGRAFDGVPVRVATDVKAAARVEYERGSLAGCDPAIYLNLGTGLAVAIVAGGKVVEGRNGASGEIGYNLRDRADVGRGLADRIPLEEVVSGGALVAAARVAAPELDSAAAVFAGAAEQPAVGRLLDEFLTELAFHLVNLTIAVDPQRIAVGGGMVRSWDLIGPRLRTALDAAVPFPPELVPAAYPYDAPLIGALALGVEAAHERLIGATAATPRHDN
jgi:predicted NBD/HSP70 family sugar kinase